MKIKFNHKKIISIIVIIFGFCKIIYAQDNTSNDWKMKVFAGEKINPEETGR
jgi:hypothetical protein